MLFSHFWGDILLKAANGPILAKMTLRPNSPPLGWNFCRQFWVNSKEINKIFRFQGKGSIHISPFFVVDDQQDIQLQQCVKTLILC